MNNHFRGSATIFGVLIGIAISLSLGASLWSVLADTILHHPDENLPQPVASYKIGVRLRLDDEQRPKHLEGREQLIWLNDSPDTISDLQFHLYLNAFKNEKSTFFKESGGRLRDDSFQPRGSRAGLREAALHRCPAREPSAPPGVYRAACVPRFLEENMR